MEADLKANGGTFQTYPSDDPNQSVRHRVFPTSFECQDIIEASMTSAIVYYSQLLTTGNADGDVIQSNSKSLRDEMWAYSIGVLQDNGIEKQSVETLNNAVVAARNGKIAHADGREFNAETNDSGEMVAYGSYEQSWQSIDTKQWYNVTWLLMHQFGLLGAGISTAG